MGPDDVGVPDDEEAVGADAVDPDRVLSQLGAALGDRLVEVVPGWVAREVGRIVEAWAASGAIVDRAAVGADTEEAGIRAAADVAVTVRAMLAADVDAQGSTPLQIVRRAVSYPTAVLQRAGVPGVVRDAFDEARFPDDPYGLTPASLTAVDASLTDLARAWGAAKAMAHKARHRGS